MSPHIRGLCEHCDMIVCSFEPGEWSHSTTRISNGSTVDGELLDDDHQAEPKLHPLITVSGRPV